MYSLSCIIRIHWSLALFLDVELLNYTAAGRTNPARGTRISVRTTYAVAAARNAAVHGGAVGVGRSGLAHDSRRKAVAGMHQGRAVSVEPSWLIPRPDQQGLRLRG